jgi:hypothetical protein
MVFNFQEIRTSIRISKMKQAKTKRKTMRKTLLIMASMTTMLLHGVEQEDVWAREFAKFPEYYKTLEEKFDDPRIVDHVIGRFAAVDGGNPASKGEQEALDWARKVAASEKHRDSFDALWYLALKGDAKDVELFSALSARYDLTDILLARVAGTNVVMIYEPNFPDIYPSVANTGPQGVYVHRIIWRAWEDMGPKRSWDGARESVTKLGELRTMVISFDKDGNPVSSVDLSKYGLSMPVIEPKPTANDSRGTKRTVTFPHDTAVEPPPPPGPGTPPPPEPDPLPPPAEPPPPEQPGQPPADRNLLWPALLALAALLGGIGVFYAWRKRKINNHTGFT